MTPRAVRSVPLAAAPMTALCWATRSRCISLPEISKTRSPVRSSAGYLAKPRIDQEIAASGHADAITVTCRSF
jgi:hypothetical protein